MLKITVPPFDLYDEATDTFITCDKEVTLKMENSLYAISLWEQHYKKPYFPKRNINPYIKKEDLPPDHTPEEMIYYIRCMVIGIEDPDEVDENLILNMGEENWQKVSSYLQDTRSATTIVPDKNAKKSSRTLTSEVIYAWIAETQLSMETQYWNINRLFNCLQIINEDNAPPDKKKKKKAHEQMKEWNNENMRRRAELGTKG